MYVRPSVGLSSALRKNGESDPDAVWHYRSDRFRDEAGSGVRGSVHGTGYFGGEFGTRHCYQWAYVCDSAMTLPSSQITCYLLLLLVWLRLILSM